MDRRDIAFYLLFGISLLIVVAIRWAIYRLDVSRIRKLLQRDDHELLTCKQVPFGPNWLSVWLTGFREFLIRYKNPQAATFESYVLTSIFFGTQFLNETPIEKSQTQDDNDRRLRDLIEFHKNN